MDQCRKVQTKHAEKYNSKKEEEQSQGSNMEQRA